MRLTLRDRRHEARIPGTEAPAIRELVDLAVRDYVRASGQRVIGLGSWVTGNGYRCPLSSPDPSDHDMTPLFDAVTDSDLLFKAWRSMQIFLRDRIIILLRRCLPRLRPREIALVLRSVLRKAERESGIDAAWLGNLTLHELVDEAEALDGASFQALQGWLNGQRHRLAEEFARAGTEISCLQDMAAAGGNATEKFHQPLRDQTLRLLAAQARARGATPSRCGAGLRREGFSVNVREGMS